MCETAMMMQSRCKALEDRGESGWRPSSAMEIVSDDEGEMGGEEKSEVYCFGALPPEIFPSRVTSAPSRAENITSHGTIFEQEYCGQIDPPSERDSRSSPNAAVTTIMIHDAISWRGCNGLSGSGFSPSGNARPESRQ
jgi:hypothetical protein